MADVDDQLLGELLDRHGAALKLYARQWCITPDDVVQQAFIDLASCSIAPQNCTAWLFAVVRRQAISHSRSERRRQRHEAAAGEEWFVRVVKQNEAAQSAAEALAELPIEDREIVVAHLWGRLTFAAVARLVGTSSSTAQRRYEAAIDRIREKLAGRNNVPCPKSST